MTNEYDERRSCVWCVEPLQGYGMTETCCAAGCITVPDYWPQYTTCGPVLPGAELRLESVPGMAYTAVACKCSLAF